MHPDCPSGPVDSRRQRERGDVQPGRLGRDERLQVGPCRVPRRSVDRSVLAAVVHDHRRGRRLAGEPLGEATQPVEAPETLDERVPRRRLTDQDVRVEVDPDLDCLGGDEDGGTISGSTADTEPTQDPRLQRGPVERPGPAD